MEDRLGKFSLVHFHSVPSIDFYSCVVQRDGYRARIVSIRDEHARLEVPFINQNKERLDSSVLEEWLKELEVEFLAKIDFEKRTEEYNNVWLLKTRRIND